MYVTTNDTRKENFEIEFWQYPRLMDGLTGSQYWSPKRKSLPAAEKNILSRQICID